MIKELEKGLRLQEIGSIKIGGKGEKRTSQGGKEWRLPTKLDHFIITTKQRNSAGDFIQDMDVHKKIGLEPKKLKIRLLYDDIDLNFNTNYVYYHGKTCLCRGDGEFALRRTKDGILNEIQCDREKCEFAVPDPKNKGIVRCKWFGRLQCILDETNIIGGVHTFRTTSINSIFNVVSSLKFIQSVTGGMLAGLPLEMTISPKTVTPEGVGTTTIYVINIIFPGSTESLLTSIIGIAERRMVSGVKLREIQEAAKIGGLLTSHFEQEEEEIRDITDEFYPEGVEVEVVASEIIESKPLKPKEANGNGENGGNGNNGDDKNGDNGKTKKAAQESVDIFEGMNIL